MLAADGVEDVLIEIGHAFARVQSAWKAVVGRA